MEPDEKLGQLSLNSLELNIPTILTLQPTSWAKNNQILSHFFSTKMLLGHSYALSSLGSMFFLREKTGPKAAWSDSVWELQPLQCIHQPSGISLNSTKSHNPAPLHLRLF